MGPQHPHRINIEGILHVASRMVGRYVQQFEAVFVALHFTACQDLEPQTPQRRTHLAYDLGDGMYATH